jgi:peroxiredoxin
VTDTNTGGLALGQEMPTFELPDQEGRPFDLLRRLDERPVVLVFYRGDWWPYWNGQLVSYARKYEEFEKRETWLVGVSVDPPSRNKAMVEKLGLPFSLLSDPRGELARRCDLWNDKEGVAVPAIVVVD